MNTTFQMLAQPYERILALRTELGLNQEDFGGRIGLAGRSRVSEIERGAPCSVDVALAIEELSIIDGKARIDAADLNADIAKARAACGGCVPHTPATTAENPSLSGGKSATLSTHKEELAA